MRVGIFTNNYLPMRGGVTSSVQVLAEGLAALGHQAWVVAPRFAGAADDPPEVLRFPSLPAFTYPEFSLAVPWSRRLFRRIEALELDVFHAQHPFLLGGTARRLARRAGRPLVFTYHTHYEKYAHYVPLRRGLVERAAVRCSTRFADRSDLVIAPSQAVRDALRNRGVRVPIAVVPTGVPLESFAPGDRIRARAALDLPPDEPILLYVGRLDPEKSVELLLDAFGLVTEVLPRARFLLVGQGTHARALRVRARALTARDRVSFLGVKPREALPDYYRAADVFWFASRTETQGLVLAEAAACGLPAVAVAAPGLEEVVTDGETGLLVKPEPQALAETAIAMLVDAALRQAMGERARERARHRFDARAQVVRVASLYAGLLDGRAP